MSGSGTADFARRIVDEYRAHLTAEVRQCVLDALAAGEDEVGAITAVEMAPVTFHEIDELLALAETFDPMDAEVAGQVAECARARLAG